MDREEEEGFVIRDKRGQSREESPSSQPLADTASTSEGVSASVSGAGTQQKSRWISRTSAPAFIFLVSFFSWDLCLNAHGGTIKS